MEQRITAELDAHLDAERLNLMKAFVIIEINYRRMWSENIKGNAPKEVLNKISELKTQKNELVKQLQYLDEVHKEITTDKFKFE